MRRHLIALAVLCSPGFASAADYRCRFDRLASVYLEDGKITGTPINFPDNDITTWQFELKVSKREMKIDWPQSPIQLNGKGPLIQTGQASFATFLPAAGPCMFTEGHCGASLHVVGQPDGSLQFQLQPLALTRIENDQRVPLKVLADGTCQLLKASK